jgi:hypothetical protein
MKRFLLMVVAAIFAINLSVSAQGMPSPEQMAKQQSAAMKADLGLDDKQEKAIYDKVLNFGKEMQEMMSSGTDQQTMMTKMQEKQKAMIGEFKKILTEEQFKKLEEKMSQMRRR